MVHAENHDMIRWLADRLIDGGHTAPKFHARRRTPSSPKKKRPVASFIFPSCSTSPIFIVHVSAPGALDGHSGGAVPAWTEGVCGDLSAVLVSYG